jgi:hypothetical protein
MNQTAVLDSQQLLERLRHALQPDQAQLAHDIEARLEQLERVLRHFVEHGAGANLLPQDSTRWDAADWFEYLHRVDRSVRRDAQRGLT